MHDENDAMVGEVFRRLSCLRSELGEGAASRAVRDVLQALGASALREAETRARALRDCRGRRPGDLTVRPFADRRGPEPWPGDLDA